MAPSAQLYGRIGIGEGSSVWHNVVMRAEAQSIRIGRYTNVQDFVMIHIGYGDPTVIGDFCSITHHTTIHGCTIGDSCLVGINAVVMDGAIVGDNCIVGENALVRAGQRIPDNSIVVGTPAAVKATRNNFVSNRINALYYYENAIAYTQGNYRRWDEPSFLQLKADEMDRLKAEMASARATTQT